METKKFNYKKIADTSYGKMSYIDEGTGEVILICHGICGGYDQAYDTLAKVEHNYRILAPSRFGYPGSDMPENATIEMQVETFKELLDQLGIDKTYVLGTSAGALVIQHLRHQKRKLHMQDHRQLCVMTF